MIQNAIRHIILAGLCIGCVAEMYFLLLVMHAPFLVIIPVVLCSIYVVVNCYLKTNITVSSHEKYTTFYLIGLIAGLVCICWKIALIAQPHGGWDAWMMWNYHARYMADGRYWKLMFQNFHSLDHPDYPLCLPSFCGFIIRLFSGRFYVFIPFVFHVFITISAAVLLYSALAKKNMLVAVIAFSLIASDTFFIQSGVSQYADTLFAFFLLCAIVSMEYIKDNVRYVAISAACIGCCLWTKNEGECITPVFLLFNSKTFFTRENIKYTIAGLIVPLAAWLTLKIAYAPPDDMVKELGQKIYAQAFITGRYKLIYTYFINNLNSKFYYVKITFFLYIGSIIVQRKFPSMHFFMLTTCLLCYLFFYVFTHLDLDWHLSTSQDRLMHQLMPAAFYTMAFEIAGFISAMKTKKIRFFTEHSIKDKP